MSRQGFDKLNHQLDNRQNKIDSKTRRPNENDNLQKILTKEIEPILKTDTNLSDLFLIIGLQNIWRRN
jgi:hypothetical protein